MRKKTLISSFLLSKLAVIAGTVSVTLLAANSLLAQQDFDFSSLPTKSETLREPVKGSRARIITPQDNRLRISPQQSGELTTSQLPGMQQPGFHRASTVSQVVTEQPGTVQPTGHSTATTRPAPARLYRLANCDWRQFEYNLISMWMKQPRVETLQDGHMMRVAIPSADPQTQSSMLVNRRDSTLFFEGPDKGLADWHEVVQILDREQVVNDQAVCFIDTKGMEEEAFQKVSYMIRTKQQQDNDAMRAVQLPPNGNQDQGDNQGGGPVGARVLPDLDLLVLTGDAQDVEDLQRRIQDFLEAARAAAAKPKTIPLTNADPTTTATAVQEIYDEQFQETQGQASIRPILNPRGLLVVGKDSAVKIIEAIAAEFDREPGEVVPDAKPQFRSYKLRFMSAIDAKQRVDEYFGQSVTGTLQNPPEPENVATIADYRANVLIVKASPSYLQQIDLLIKELDIADSDSTNEIRIIKLRNTEAVQIAAVLQYAINGSSVNAPQVFNPSQNQQGAVQPPAPVQIGAQPNQSQIRSTTLQLMTVDRNGNEVRTGSGILFDVGITADEGSNSLIVTGPAESMDLIEALVERLDVIPDIETQIKVFQVINGDASTLINMLNTLFGGDQQNQNQNTGGISNLPVQSVSASDGQSLASLRFTLDERTNSIIASGPVGELEVVRNLLTRLDEDDVNRRDVAVITLNNAYSVDVATAVNNWLDERTNLVSNNFNSAFVQNQREVIVVPETVSNSLIISALPQYFAEVLQVVESLDRRPTMVEVEVLLAEVSMSATEEFGIELGVQDSLLFGRGQSIAAPLDSALLTTGEALAGTARANFAVGGTNADLGYGGLVLSAGNESINLLLRALKDRGCLRVLSKPHLMTIENLQGRVSVGSNVPRVTGTTITNFGVQNNVVDIDVGVTLEVTPRVSPDGMIVMFVNAINSSLAEGGVVIGTDANGTPLESPIINQTTAQTTIMARSGQTVVFSGLIQESKSHSKRGAPIISSLPILGPLFGFESDVANRSELLIIMKPRIVEGGNKLQQINNEHMDRMHWCMSDVAEAFGSVNYDGTQIIDTPTTYYPDMDPSGLNPIESNPIQSNPIQSTPNGSDPMRINPNQSRSYPQGLPAESTTLPGQSNTLPQARTGAPWRAGGSGITDTLPTSSVSQPKPFSIRGREQSR